MELILWTLSALLLIWTIVIYNRLVRDKNRVLAAWSDIDVQLKRRHDLIPKLVDAVNAYAHYEQTTLDGITHLRSEADRTDNPAEKSTDCLILHPLHTLNRRLRSQIQARQR